MSETKRAEADDYNPFSHREVKNPTTNFETLVHLLKCSLGTGILALPQAFSRAGVATASISIIIIGIIITHCLHILVRSQYELCKRIKVPLLTYTDTMRVAFETGPVTFRRYGKAAGVIVDLFLCIYQLGTCCVYTLFIARNFKQIADPHYEMSIEVHMLIILLPLLLANCIPNLKILAPFSLVANLLILVSVLIIIYYVFSLDKKTSDGVDLWGTILEFPLFFGTMMFALSCVQVVITLENNMKTPEAFLKPFGTLNVGMAFVVLVYLSMGVAGYLFCLSECSDSITQDVPSTTPPALVMMVMYAIAILITYVLQCYVPVQIIWTTYLKPCLLRRGSEKIKPWKYALRIFLCLVTFLLALAVPRLGLFISLFGAFCLSGLSMIFPAILEVLCHVPDKFGPCRIVLIKDIIIMLLGVLGLVVGTSTAIKAIVESFQ